MFPPPWNMAARIRAGRFTRFPLRCCSQGLSGRRTMCPLPAGCGWLRNSVGHAEIGANVGNPHDLVVRRCGPGMTHFDPQQPFASIDGNAGPCPISVVRSRNQIPARTTESEPSVPVADGFATTATSKRFECRPEPGCSQSAGFQVRVRVLVSLYARLSASRCPFRGGTGCVA